MSLRGCVVFLKFYLMQFIVLSFLKISIKVWKNIMKVQRIFCGLVLDRGLRSISLGGLMFVSPRSLGALVFATFNSLT